MFKFNISHSGAWVVCAIADTEVGIDVEEIKPIDFSVSQCFFSKREHQQLMMQREELRLAYFYNLWTMKESYIKCKGKGLSIPLNSFTVCVERQCVIASTDYPSIPVLMIDLEDQYKLSVCSMEHLATSNIEVINISNVAEQLLWGIEKTR